MLVALFIEDRDRPRDDVDFVLARQPGEKLDVARHLAGEIDDLLADRPADVAQGEELDGKILRKDEEVALVIDRRLDQRADLIAKLLESLNRPDEVLQRSDSNAFHHFPSLIIAPASNRGKKKRR